MEIEENTEVLEKKNLHQKKGKYQRLEQLFRKTLIKGNFESLFLMDNEGLMISEYSKSSNNEKALSALFSLVQNSIMRALNAINADKLHYVKISIESGEYLIRNIDIKNYNKSFILVTFYKFENNERDITNKAEVANKKSLFKRVIDTIMNYIRSLFRTNSVEISLGNNYPKNKRVYLINLLADKIEKIFI